MRGRLLSLGVVANELPLTRLGIRTSKQFRSSVQRNRMKRLLREAYRQHVSSLVSGRDMLVVLKQPGTLQDVDQELLRALKKSGVLNA